MAWPPSPPAGLHKVTLPRRRIHATSDMQCDANALTSSPGSVGVVQYIVDAAGYARANEALGECNAYCCHI